MGETPTPQPVKKEDVLKTTVDRLDGNKDSQLDGKDIVGEVDAQIHKLREYRDASGEDAGDKIKALQLAIAQTAQEYRAQGISEQQINTWIHADTIAAQVTALGEKYKFRDIRGKTEAAHVKVKAIQTVLVSMGYDVGTTNIDGFYGPPTGAPNVGAVDVPTDSKTRQAVRKLQDFLIRQKAYGNEPAVHNQIDGLFGEKTLKALKQFLKVQTAAPAPQPPAAPPVAPAVLPVTPPEIPAAPAPGPVGPTQEVVPPIPPVAPPVSAAPAPKPAPESITTSPARVQVVPPAPASVPAPVPPSSPAEPVPASVKVKPPAAARPTSPAVLDANVPAPAARVSPPAARPEIVPPSVPAPPAPQEKKVEMSAAQVAAVYEADWQIYAIKEVLKGKDPRAIFRNMDSDIQRNKAANKDTDPAQLLEKVRSEKIKIMAAIEDRNFSFEGRDTGKWQEIMNFPERTASDLAFKLNQIFAFIGAKLKSESGKGAQKSAIPEDKRSARTESANTSGIEQEGSGSILAIQVPADTEPGKNYDARFKADIAKGKRNIEQMAQRAKFVLVDFSAQWCGPCNKMESETLKPLSQKQSRDFLVSKFFDSPNRIEFSNGVWQNVVKEITGSTAVPALALYKDGKLIEILPGYKKTDAINAWLKSKGVPQ